MSNYQEEPIIDSGQMSQIKNLKKNKNNIRPSKSIDSELEDKSTPLPGTCHVCCPHWSTANNSSYKKMVQKQIIPYSEVDSLYFQAVQVHH